VTTTEPVIVHFLGDLSVTLSRSAVGHARVMEYGDQLELTDEIIQASRDRNGNSWLVDWLNSGEDEHRRGDKVIARRGPWPAGTCRLRPGSFAWHAARDQAVRETFEITDPVLRAQHRRDLDAYYGRPPATSRTHMTTSPAPAQ
jgi:hypothetical protein